MRAAESSWGDRALARNRAVPDVFAASVRVVVACGEAQRGSASSKAEARLKGAHRARASAGCDYAVRESRRAVGRESEVSDLAGVVPRG